MTKKLKLIKNFIYQGYAPRTLILVIDIALCVLAYLFTYNFFLHYIIPKQIIEHQFNIVVFATCISTQLIWFFVFKTYVGIIRYSTLIDIVKLLYSVLANVATLLIINFIVTEYFNFSMSRYVIVIYGLVAYSLLIVFRLLVKTLYDILISKKSNTIPVLVYGTKAAGVAIAQLIMTSNDSKYRVVGFVDNKVSADKYILGLPIYAISDEEKLLKRIEQKSIGAVIVSPVKFSEIDANSDLNIFINHSISILLMPKLGDAASNNNTIDVDRNLRNLQIDDLLNRKTIQIDKQPIKSKIVDKVILVTGAAGSIGSEIVRQLSDFNPTKIILLDSAETPLHNIRLEITERWSMANYVFTIADVRNRKVVEKLIAKHRPDLIFHAAAYKHVPMMEAHPSECIMANVLGTKNVVDMAVKYGVKSFVMVSTDKAVNPTNVMGCSKRIAEIYVQSYFKKMIATNTDTTQIITTRFGNVLGSNGSVIPLFKKQIAAGGPVTVTHPDIIRYFMTIPEACQLVLEAGTIGTGGNIYLFDMGAAVRIADLAKKMIRLAGLEPEKDIKIEYSGLRPGEKLYEELLSSKEHAKSAVNDKIMIANAQEYEYDDVEVSISDLINAAINYDDDAVVKKMKAIVPEYVSQNSIYTALDKN